LLKNISAFFFFAFKLLLKQSCFKSVILQYLDFSSYVTRVLFSVSLFLSTVVKLKQRFFFA